MHAGTQRGEFTVILPFRVTPDQREQLRQLATQRGVSVSELIRSAVLPDTHTTGTQRDGATLPAK